MLKDKCINVSNVLGTPHAGEVEIYDFVTERANRCIAANNENGQKYSGKPTMVDEFKNCFRFLVRYFM